jgi:sodium-dependent dicarboxylate transporter 2/3/5
MTVPSGATSEVDGPKRADSSAERGTLGSLLALLAFVSLLLAPLGSLSPEAHRLAAIMAAVVILWVTEALPMPVTAIIGAIACVVLRVAPAREVFAPFADPLMFLFIGSFMIARAIMLHGLDRRVAYAVLSLRVVGESPTRILFAFGAVTAAISAWISNTATTAMMFAIGMAILAFMADSAKRDGRTLDPRYATALMLMTSFAASVGGLATPIGTPPNVIGLGFIRQLTGTELPFFKWMLIGMPTVVIMLFAVFFVLGRSGRNVSVGMAESASMLEREHERRGNWSVGEKSTLIAFSVTVFLWVLPGVLAIIYGETSREYTGLTARLPEGVAALIGACLLFVLPGDQQGKAITWREAAKIDWGIVLLYGGGFALGVLSFNTGLAETLGKAVLGYLPTSGETGLLIASTIMAVILSEITSNTASANMIVPVVISIANAAGVDPVVPALGATFGASLGFMLPVSTPCNAIVYGSGYIPLKTMMRHGVIVDIVGVVVIVAVMKFLLPLVR